MLSTRPKRKREYSAHECVRNRIKGVLNSLFFFKFLVASTIIVNDCKTNALTILIAVGRPLEHPWGTHGNPGGMVQFWHFFFLVGDERCLVLETTSLDHRNIPTGFVRVSSRTSRPSFFRTIFISSFRCDISYCVVAVHTFR